jgi:hypothetical protein
VNCVPASGSTFAVGTTTVTCTATDAHGNTGQGTFKVTVVLVDTTPPAFSNVPAAIRQEADGLAGSKVVYTAPTAVDNIDGPLPVLCTPASGKVFALGVTTVSCSAADAHGNSAVVTFKVSIVDTTPPRLVVPPASDVYATSSAGISADEPVVRAFLGAAAATDLVDDHPSITNDAPATLPVGNDTVTFIATDKSGNSTRGAAVLTVRPQPPPGTPQLPPKAVDRVAPDDVSGLTVKVGNRLVRMRWRNPRAADFAYVLITRSLPTPGAPSVTVYRGKGVQLVDRKVQNDVSYRYVIVAFDEVGNGSGGVALTATPKRVLLTSPPDGAKIKSPPELVWIGKARFFNVQLYRGTRKVLSAWPAKNRLKLRKRWMYEKRLRRLTDGTYRWYVWPAHGTRQNPEYGVPLGTSTFIYGA